MKPVFVIGHRNPDTDSICSAIGYANLKHILTGNEYIACRAGDVGAETEYVLKAFGVEPELSCVRPNLNHLDPAAIAASQRNHSATDQIRSRIPRRATAKTLHTGSFNQPQIEQTLPDGAG